MSNKVITPPKKAKGIVHKMIADIAKGCCKSAWQDLARQNRFYKANPNVQAFVERHWPRYLPVARQILTGMLGSPKYTQATKDEIMDVLLKDGAVNPKAMAEPAKPNFFLGPKH